MAGASWRWAAADVWDGRSGRSERGWGIRLRLAKRLLRQPRLRYWSVAWTMRRWANSSPSPLQLIRKSICPGMELSKEASSTRQV